MNLHFNYLKLHNFGSYADAELDLSARGFCLVAGENNFSLDNAISNGAGKSTLWSAICFAITGETIQGLTTNLKNINIEEDSCYVEVNLTVNTDTYVITRYHRPKNDLIIFKNGNNISGKGIRESEKILIESLPDLTKDLIASTIIIGQGMPNKFSSFSPSGRKELLEKLTKSDFMIEDIKNRLLNRQSKVSQLIRQYADSLLVNKTNLENISTKKQKDEQDLINLDNQNFDQALDQCSKNIAQIEAQLTTLMTVVTTDEASVEDINAALLTAATEKTTEYSNLNTSYNNSISTLQVQKYQLDSDIKSLQVEIKKLKSITDICPTCGQKLPNVSRPDTSKLETELSTQQATLADIDEKLAAAKIKYDNYAASIEQNYSTKTFDLQKQLKEIKERIVKNKAQIVVYNKNLSNKKEEYLRLNLAKTNFEAKHKTLTNAIEAANLQILELKNLITITEAAKIEANEHLAVLKKMDMLVKRDFRGYLLTDIIKYIDAKAKEYCKTVFDNTSLSVYLDGNALSISYDNKLFDNLSGGEKQKCDLILQFAIRDLLQTYLNYSANILVLDEIFDGLDKVSTNKTIELITNKLKDVESIFIISHHADELSLPIDSAITVVKNTVGISEIK